MTPQQKQQETQRIVRRLGVRLTVLGHRRGAIQAAARHANRARHDRWAAR